MAALPLICMFGKCGELFDPNMRDSCPQQCSSNSYCLTCLKSAHCGWCGDGNDGQGVCSNGYLGKCGIIVYNN